MKRKTPLLLLNTVVKVGLKKILMCETYDVDATANCYLCQGWPEEDTGVRKT